MNKKFIMSFLLVLLVAISASAVSAADENGTVVLSEDPIVTVSDADIVQEKVNNAVAGGIVLANANKVINKTEKKDEETPLISIGFSQVGAESEWRTGNSISIKTTFSQKRGYDLIFKSQDGKSLHL